MKKIHINSFIFKIIATVVAGSIGLAVSLSLVNLWLSKRVFINSFAESQSRIFNQIDNEFYQFMDGMTDIMEGIGGNNQYVKKYFLADEEKIRQVDDMDNRYRMEASFHQLAINDYNGVAVFILGKSGESYIYRDSDKFIYKKNEIWNSDVAAAARLRPGQIVCRYQTGGFTSTSKDSPVIIWAKAWHLDEDDTADMAGFITVKEEEIRKMYSHFTSQASDIVLMNQDNEVISSNNSEYLRADSEAVSALCRQIETMAAKDVYQEETNGQDGQKRYMIQRLQSTNYKIIGIISPEAAFKEQYNIAVMIVLTVMITGIVALLIIFFMNQQTRPIGEIVRVMQNSGKEQFRQKVNVKGTDEVRTLAKTYNQMVEELDQYIHQLIQAEDDKRTVEIYALQMQINPHYMYNTLAGIKWLIRQGDSDKSTQVIDAFIAMLRNVISNSDKLISVGQEVENLKNYVFVNQARYGDSVTVEYYILPQCLNYQIPKMILQPLVENAFFHAFPDGRRGSINIFIKEEKGDIRFDIVDNGVGMTEKQLSELRLKKQFKGEHFTGIGIQNVDERIKLLYGSEYGIKIVSREGKGTTVTLTLRVESNEKEQI